MSVFTLTDSEGVSYTETRVEDKNRMQLNSCFYFFIFYPLASSSPLLPGERVEIFARAIHSLIPGHGPWSEAGGVSQLSFHLAPGACLEGVLPPSEG